METVDGVGDGPGADHAGSDQLSVVSERSSGDHSGQSDGGSGDGNRGSGNGDGGSGNGEAGSDDSVGCQSALGSVGDGVGLFTCEQMICMGSEDLCLYLFSKTEFCWEIRFWQNFTRMNKFIIF